MRERVRELKREKINENERLHKKEKSWVKRDYNERKKGKEMSKKTLLGENEKIYSFFLVCSFPLFFKKEKEHTRENKLMKKRKKELKINK